MFTPNHLFRKQLQTVSRALVTTTLFILYGLHLKISACLLLIVIIVCLNFNNAPRPQAVHIILIISYLLCVVFFINIPSYQIKLKYFTKNHYMSSIYFGEAINWIYEAGAALINFVSSLKFKHVFSHPNTFIIYTNGFSSSYELYKNHMFFRIFCEEYVWGVFIILNMALFGYLYDHFSMQPHYKTH